MGWMHPDIGLDELLVFVRAFVDILVLASGYQSSGYPAYWEPENTKKALQWAIFFEDVLKKLPASEDGKASKQALDMALVKLTSDPLFPQGLPLLTSATLAESRKLLLGSLLQAVDLRDEQLTSVLTVAYEMDCNDLRDNSKQAVPSSQGHRSSGNAVKIMKKGEDKASINEQIDNIKQADASGLTDLNVLGDKHIEMAGNSQGEFHTNDLGSEAFCLVDGEGSKQNSNKFHSNYVIEEIMKRHLAVACTESLQKGLGVLVDSVTLKEEVATENEIWKDNMNSASTSRYDSSTLESELWGQWKLNGLLYLLDAKTLRMVSGASLIFSGTKLQWVRALELLKGPSEKLDDNKMSEIVELCFLGLAAKRWNYSIRRFMLASYPFISIPRMWYNLQKFLTGKASPPYIEEEIVDLKRLELEEYLLQLLNKRVQLLWRVPPILAASTLTVRSDLLALYMDKIQKHIDSDATKTRCYNSYWDSQKYLECEIGERICCLYIFVANLHYDSGADSNTM